MSEQDVNNIIYFVIQVEKEGAAYYQKLAYDTSNEAAKGMFLKLANDEVRHQQDFQELANIIKKENHLLEASFDLVQAMQRETEMLKATIKGSRPMDISEVTLKNAFDIGIHSEKEAIRIYTELLSVKNPDIALVVPRVIMEEKKHLQMLETLKMQLLG